MGRNTQAIKERINAAARPIEVEIYDSEILGIFRHVTTNGIGFVVKNHDEQLGLYDMFDELGLIDAYNDVQLGILSDDKLRAAFSSKVMSIVTLSPNTVEFFLGKFTDGTTGAAASLLIAPLIRRLKSAKRGEYKLPQQPDIEPKAAESA